MKEIWKYITSRQGSSRITGDMIMLGGVLLLNWSLLRIISIFWLDTVVMVVFFFMFLNKLFGGSSEILTRIVNTIYMLICSSMIVAFMLAFYLIAYDYCRASGENLKEEDFLYPFLPYYQTIAILISIICGNYFEYQAHVGLLEKNKALALNFLKIFIYRYFIIAAVILSVAYMSGLFTQKRIIVIPMILLVVLKNIVEISVYKTYQKKLEETRDPMI